MKSFFKIFTILTPKQMRFAAGLIVLMLVCAFMEAVGIGLLYPLIAVINSPAVVEKVPKLSLLLEKLGIKTSSRQEGEGQGAQSWRSWRGSIPFHLTR